MNKILIVEDETIIRMALRKLLERHGYDVNEAGSVHEACQQYRLDDHNLIISDLRLPGDLGTELIEKASNTPVLIMTSYASLRSAVDAMRMGAVDYIAKPFDHDEMVATVQRILSETPKEPAKDQSQGKTLTNQQGEMIGSCDIMQRLFDQISKVSPTHATILIRGETGTGKELVARAIHNASQRANKPLICINCAAIPETLIESELFGHEKGAFTGAASQREGLVVASNDGTLFLDEIGELPLEAQARLLRVLQEGEVRPLGSTSTQKVNIRLLAATHRDLHQRCQQGLFREDLYFRLNVIQLNVPPLRERGDDIITLAEALVARYCDSYGKATLQLSSAAKQRIRQHTWPGNVRELENIMQRAVILCEDHEIDVAILSIETTTSHSTQSSPLGNNSINHPSHNNDTLHLTSNYSDNQTHNPNSNLSLEDYFQRFVIENQHKMSETDLAKKLGISRKSLWERRQKLGIPRKKNN